MKGTHGRHGVSGKDQIHLLGQHIRVCLLGIKAEKHAFRAGGDLCLDYAGEACQLVCQLLHGIMQKCQPGDTEAHTPCQAVHDVALHPILLRFLMQHFLNLL